MLTSDAPEDNERQQVTQQFLDWLAPGAVFDFRTFDDTKLNRRDLVRTFRGTLEEHWKALDALNQRGAGVFVTINGTDGEGLRAENVNEVRAVFVDFDTPEPERPNVLSEVLTDFPPSLLVESSPGKHHAYWRAPGLSLEEFKPLQRGLATWLGGDQSINDLPRVMRLPGFFHCKSDPSLIRILAIGEDVDAETVRRTIAPFIPSVVESSDKAPMEFLSDETHPYVCRALESASTAVLSAPEGCRNDTLNREAFGLFGFVKGGQLEEGAVRNILYRAAIGAGLNSPEVIRTLNNAWASSPSREIPRYEVDPEELDFNDEDGLSGSLDDAAERETALVDALELNKAKYLLNVEPPPQSYVIEGLIPEPVAAVIVAPGSTGKSFWLMQLAVCVATGVPFFELPIAKPGGVLMLGAEDNRDEMGRRLHSIIRASESVGNRLDMAKLGENFYPVSRLGCDNRLTLKAEGNTVHNKTLITEVIKAAQAIPDLRLIILDPVSRFRSGDENASEDGTRFVEALELIRRETGVTVLCAHHSRKGSKGDSADDIRGASAFVDAVRFAATLAVPDAEMAKKLGMDEQSRRAHVRFNVVKSNYRTETDTFWMRRGIGGVLEMIPPLQEYSKVADKGEQRFQATLPKLLEFIQKKDSEGRPITRNGLRDYAGTEGLFGVGDQSLRTIVNRAIDEGEVFLRDNGTLHTW
ncbi:AAA family ATPase [Halomonas sp. M4R1S46]|uniref:AAA family ATPase n=1 Tax=Halomonas sp. M4R1S46 TaxID=2982692 RepID=UPI0021E3FBE6|nr:AAA family ATPase [Halomonas sp. M4R1S46]UYG08055.1 AAA family ATPase [Halomonas sp. M4R1S46]